MQRIILFSSPTDSVIADIKPYLFPSQLSDKRVAYMPSDGAVNKEKYTTFWRELSEACGVGHFEYINNSLVGNKASLEIERLMKCNIMIITGGNTFRLMRNLRRSGMYDAIKDFSNKKSFIIAGFRAGAIVLTPTIKIADYSKYDKNEDSITAEEFESISLVEFEIFAHYNTDTELDAYSDKYAQNCANKLYKLKDTDYIICDKEESCIINIE